ncbi:ribonuclease H-like domain-containing protein [Cristinia sonorae]|uniref:Ribonuclease H-like domain-containing protein n=1 Tax=Cristinia sonorae TaxID=1940300 RepID=A0A8K0UTL2_9AGAR|nr:ribonuclease H-like domain-containing protein [Cristinia sonorae]
MALQSVKEIVSNAALRHTPPRPPTSPSRRTSTTRTSSPTPQPPKSRILAMLDAEMGTLSLDDSLNQSTKKPTQTRAQSAHGNLFVPGTTKVLTSSTSSHPFFSDNRTLGEGSRPRLPQLESAANTVKPPTVQATTNDTPVLYSHRNYNPSPALVYTCHEEEADDLVQSLKGPLGFDLEWRVFIRKNHPTVERRTAVVQLSDEKMILIIQVSSMQKFPQKVKEVIESHDIVKMGANIANDGRKLFRDFGILPANLVELGGLAREADPHCPFTRSVTALATVVERYTGKTLDKGKVRSSNWEMMPLSKEQLEYAGNDAHCALMVYNHLIKLAATSNRTLTPSRFTSDIKHDYDTGKLKVKVSPTPPLSRESTNSSITTQSSNGSKGWDSPPIQPGDQPRPQHLRAYNMWHHRSMSMDQIRAALRSKENPLAVSTVISYVVGALQADTSLPFSMARLKEFVQLEAGSWKRHRDWILMKDEEQRARKDSR